MTIVSEASFQPDAVFVQTILCRALFDVVVVPRLVCALADICVATMAVVVIPSDVAEMSFESPVKPLYCSFAAFAIEMRPAALVDFPARLVAVKSGVVIDKTVFVLPCATAWKKALVIDAKVAFCVDVRSAAEANDGATTAAASIATAAKRVKGLSIEGLLCK